MESYNPVQISREFNVIAKHSLEKTAAAEADVFTAVSEITGRECSHFLGKPVDIVTPNGFEDSFVPGKDTFDEKRAIAREKLISVAEAILGYSLTKDSLLIVNSGRYEFRNKGVDIFIDSLGELKKRDKLHKECVAFILMPAYHKGPRQDIIDILYNEAKPTGWDKYLSHSLQVIRFLTELLQTVWIMMRNHRSN
jgi:phosphorylase/glycogen(starch) synthase